jgi:lipopolysaccharide/colanic/teichoic acid biosynthesis glycosyltransferase
MIQANFIRQSVKQGSATKLKESNSTVTGYGQTTRMDNFLKMLLDYLIVIPGLLFIAPLLLSITILIKLESPGPLIYRHRVVGRNGRRFNAYKFRTMYINGEEILANYPYVRAQLRKEYNLKCDPRLTRIGYYLRRLGLDDLPQLFNVLKQDMSLVGPRIVTYKELMKYEHHRQTLLSVMPGLTGLWQINGRPDMSFEERVEMDLEYIHNWSLKNDIKILLGTVPALFKGYRNQ